MSITKNAKIKLAAVCVFALVLLISLLLFLNQSDSVRLELARTEIDAVLSANSASVRQQHAQNCVRIVTPLVSHDNDIGTTATLFLIGVIPLVEEPPPKPDIPPADAVKLLPSEDILRIANLLFNTRRYSPADQLVGFVLSRDDEFRERALRLAATIRYDLGRDDEVLIHCNELISRNPRDKNAWQVIAMVHRNHGRWEHYVDATRQLIDLTQDTSLRLDLIDGYLRLGETAAARQEFDKVLAQLPDAAIQEPILHAKLLMQEGKTDKAEQILRGFVTSEKADAEILLMYGSLLVEKEQFEAAIPILERARQKSPAEEKIYYQLGQACARLGKDSQARTWLDKHRLLLNAKVQLHELEELAAQQPHNVTVRKELAKTYADIGLMELADFWTRAALTAEE